VAQIEQLELPNGTKILVEADDQVRPSRRMEDVSRGRDVRASLSDALADLQGVAEAVEAKMRSLSSRPDSVTLELGVSVTTEAGVVLARASAAANLKVVMQWSYADGGADEK